MTAVAAAPAVEPGVNEGAARAVRVAARRRRRPRGVVATILAIAFSIVWIFPVYWMLNTAFKPHEEVVTPTPLFAPAHPTFDNFVTAVTQTNFLQDLGNSLIVSLGAVVAAIVLGVLAAAALTLFRFRGRRAILVFILAVQMFPVATLLIPQFLIFNQLGLIGSYLGLILAYVASALPFSIWVMRGFYLGIPQEVFEAAQVDGATTWQMLWRIAFPLVTPGIISASIFAFIAAWNDYLTAYTFMQNQHMYTLTVWLASFSTPHTGTDYGAEMAGSIVFSLPVVIFFLIIQRRLVQGMSAGAVKG